MFLISDTLRDGFDHILTHSLLTTMYLFTKFTDWIICNTLSIRCKHERNHTFFLLDLLFNKKNIAKLNRSIQIYTFFYLNIQPGNKMLFSIMCWCEVLCWSEEETKSELKSEITNRDECIAYIFYYNIVCIIRKQYEMWQATETHWWMTHNSATIANNSNHTIPQN